MTKTLNRIIFFSSIKIRIIFSAILEIRIFFFFLNHTLPPPPPFKINGRSLKTISEKIEENLNMYLKLYILLYADDTVIMAESNEDPQILLNVFGEYCKKWKLKVNAEKTKILIFSRG